VGGCLPLAQDGLFIGMGVDEADICPHGKVDLDLGIVLYRCEPLSTLARDRRSHRVNATEGLGEFDFSQCRVLDYRSWFDWQRDPEQLRYVSEAHTWVQYSGDNDSGQGEGDDEWLFLRMDGLKAMGTTHVAITTHVFGCEKDPQADVKFADLEGAFLRFVAGVPHRKHFKTSETVGFVDLDEQFAQTGKYGGLAAVLFLEPDVAHKVGSVSGGRGGREHVVEDRVHLPKFGKHQSRVSRLDYARGTGHHWELVAMDLPLDRGKSLVALGDKAGPDAGCMQGVTEAVFKAPHIPENAEVAATYALMREAIGRGAAAAGSLEQELHMGLVHSANENMQYRYAKQGWRTSAIDKEAYRRRPETAEFLTEYTIAMSSGALGASTYCVEPAWIRSKAQ